MQLLGCLGIFFIVLIVAIFAAVRNILVLLFNPRRATGTRRHTTHGPSGQTRSSSTSHSAAKPAKEKIFADGEGEYVDFEEVK